MVAVAVTEGGAQAISARVQGTIQSIREIVGDHSDADIYAVLKETNMDPNETAQKLLNQDPFHEVKRKRDKKKENTDFRNLAEARKHTDRNRQVARSYTSRDQNAWSGGYVRNSVTDAGISKEFHVVRDNRSNRTANTDIKPESSQHAAFRREKVISNVPHKSATEALNDREYSSARNSVGNVLGGNRPRDSGSGCAKDTKSRYNNRPTLTEDIRSTASVSNSKAHREDDKSSQPTVSSSSTKSEVGVSSSSTDPILVPEDSVPSRTVGPIRREVGKVGLQRQSANHPEKQLSVDGFSLTQSFRQPSVKSKNNRFTQTSSGETVAPSIPVNKSLSSIQYTSKQHQQPVSHQKAMQPNMEWKPKSIKKTSISNSGVTGSALFPSTSSSDNAGGSHLEDMSGLSEKLSEVNMSDNLHVIIPHHLRVPESERAGLMFGSFGTDSDSTRTSTPFQAHENSEEFSDEPSASVPLVPPSCNEDASAANQGDLVDGKARTSQSDSLASSAEYEQPLPVTSEFPIQNIENYADIGLLQSHSPPYSSIDPQQFQSSPNLPGFSAYDTQEDVPFFRMAMGDNIHDQGFPLQPEALSSHVGNSYTPSTSAMVHQQLPVQQQPQPVTQLYSQVHIPHYQNFVPYRHMISPVFMPPIPVPNYSNNPAYPHPSSGSSYVLMPGGSSHIASGAMKYAASQYKAVPAGSPATYANYANPSGFAIGPPGSVGSANSLEDVTRIKYKDNNLYVPNPQVEASDIWVQTPRELPSLQSQQFYNISGQAPHAAYVPTHPGHASFNAMAQSSHVQYPSLYHHPQQPTSIANPHNLVQQVAPGLGGTPGVGVAAAAPQVGTYQQTQLGHLNWASNF